MRRGNVGVLCTITVGDNNRVEVVAQDGCEAAGKGK